MQVTQIINDGLKREFAVVIAKADLAAKVEGRLGEIKDKVHLKGFRPGKAPLAHLKRTFGKQMMGEVVQDTVNEAAQKAVTDLNIRPAQPPRVELSTPAEEVVAGRSDLAFTVAVDVMPDFTPVDPTTLELTRLTADIPDSDVEQRLQRLADQQRSFAARDDGAAAEKGDQLVIDFEGSIDGTPFEGGKSDNFRLVLGSGMFIPGFEEQLEGAKAGDARTVNVTFPETYGAANLAGKEASFAVTVKEVLAPEALTLDDSFAAKLGIESLDRLKDMLRNQISAEFNRAGRIHLKRALLDQLDKAHDFGLPSGMVDSEFDGIWQAVLGELAREKKTFADEGKTEDEMKDEYRKIAERRVRLGLVLAEIGRLNKLELTGEEVARAIENEARRYPGQEQEVIEMFQRNPRAVAQIRAPLYEEKVVDFIFAVAKVTDKTVAKEELFKEPEGDDVAA